MQFVKATKKKAKLRLAIEGASGSGKTYSALLLAKGLGGKIAVLDTEHGSASLYSTLVPFDVLELSPPYEPERYISAIVGAAEAGYQVLILDSITPEWKGPGGCLDIQNKLGGRYQDWAKVTPRHDAFIQAILSAPMHIICTCRSKTAYEFNPDNKKVVKAGTSPEQREGLDYEMTVVFNLNQHHMATADKDRTGLFDGRDTTISEETGAALLAWLDSGEDDPNSPEWKAKVKATYMELIEAGQPTDVLNGILETEPNSKAKYEALKKL